MCTVHQITRPVDNAMHIAVDQEYMGVTVQRAASIRTPRSRWDWTGLNWEPGIHRKFYSNSGFIFHSKSLEVPEKLFPYAAIL